METAGLIDHRNVELWNSLKVIHEIEIIRENRPDHYMFTQGGKSIIRINQNDINSASFTHELLHIYLRTKEVYIAAALSNLITAKQGLSKIISYNLIQHIGNCLDHMKMLPLFLDMGFKVNDFLSDFDTCKLTCEEVSFLKNNFNSSSIDFYIGKYFAAKCCPNKIYNYEDNFLELEKIDCKLFEILENFLFEWNSFDYNDNNPLTGGYHYLVYDFIKSLEKWTAERKLFSNKNIEHKRFILLEEKSKH